jgi:AraC-like DNA-binding protein
MRTLAVGLPHGGGVDRHSHGWDQLVYGATGVLTVDTDDGTWVVPAERAVWVPAGVSHEFLASGFVSLRTLYLPAGMAEALPRRCGVVEVSPLLRELIVHCVEIGVLDGEDPKHDSLIALVVEQLRVPEVLVLHLPWPKDARACRVATELRDNPDDSRRLEEICAGCGASKRTIERLFLFETGFTLGRWRARQRLLRSLPLLAAGRSVTEVAFDVGYDSPSAFIAMFRKTLGDTPRRYYLPGGGNATGKANV